MKFYYAIDHAKDHTEALFYFPKIGKVYYQLKLFIKLNFVILVNNKLYNSEKIKKGLGTVHSRVNFQNKVSILDKFDPIFGRGPYLKPGLLTEYPVTTNEIF